MQRAVSAVVRSTPKVGRVGTRTAVREFRTTAVRRAGPEYKEIHNPTSVPVFKSDPNSLHRAIYKNALRHQPLFFMYVVVAGITFTYGFSFVTESMWSSANRGYAYEDIVFKLPSDFDDDDDDEDDDDYD